MILCHISDSARYASVSAGLAMAIDWLQAHIDDDFVPGRYAIGDTPAGEVFVKVEDTALIPRRKPPSNPTDAISISTCRLKAPKP